MTTQVEPPTGRALHAPRVRSPPTPGVPLPPDSVGLPPQAQAPGPAAEQRRARAPAARASPPRWPCSRPTTSRRAPTPPRRSSTSSCRRSASLAFSLVMPITIALLVMLGAADPLVPGDDQGLPVRRRRVPRHPRQLRHRAGPGGRRVAARRATSSPSPCRCRPAPPRSSRRSTSLSPYRVPISLGFIVIVMYGNLRGVKESGKVFAVPTYFFMLNMAVLLGYGLVKYVGGDLVRRSRSHGEGTVEIGHAAKDAGLYMGAGAFLLARAFASGGAAVTGVEAISNGVPAFREPAWKNARQTLVLMGSGSAVMFLGLSALASKVKVIPFEDGTPTVLAQIGEAVYGSGALGEILELLAPGRHDAHPRARRQHRLRRLPAPGQLPGRRQLPPPAAHQARPPARVLQRDHRPGRHRGRSSWSRPAPRSPGSSRSTPSACSWASPSRRPA